jgi:8-oxo-dGTP pyrophosphatase MutT (NUDIX family)
VDGVTDIRQVGSREVYANPWMRLREDDIQYADGSTSIYAVVERSDFVAVLPLENDGLWLVEQFRYPLDMRMWELPQGGWPQGHGGTAQELAVAELVEETGLQAGRWQHLGRLAANPGLMSQYFDVFLATDLTPGAPEREASEADMVHRWFPLSEVHAMITAGTLVDVHSVAALSLYALSPRAE